MVCFSKHISLGEKYHRITTYTSIYIIIKRVNLENKWGEDEIALQEFQLIGKITQYK